MKKIIIFLFTLVPVLLQAQVISPSEEHQIRLKVVDLLEEYEKYSNMDRDFKDFGDSFRSLFTSDQNKVYNDLNYVAGTDELSVVDYVKALTEKSTTTRSNIKNVDCKSIESSGDKVRVVCTFDKYVNITNECGVEFASDFFNASDYHETATIIYDKASNLCLFETISGNVESKRTLSKDYRVIKMDRDFGYDLKYAGKSLDPNAMNQCFVPMNGTVTCKDPDMVVTMKEESKECNLWSVSVKPKRFRIKAHFDMPLGEVYDISGKESLNNCKTKGWNAGLDFGYMFPSKSQIKFGAFIGVGMSQSTIDLGYDNSDYYYTTTNDVDGDSYTRHYQNLKLDQTIKLTDLIVPVYLDIDYHISSMVSIYADLGAQLHLNMTKKIDATTGSAYVYGVYPQYDNLLMNEEWGYNGFGNQTFSTNSLVNSDLLDINSFTANAFGRIGVRVNIPSTPLAVDLGATYTYGFMDVIKKNSNQVQFSGQTQSTALVYNNISGLNSTEQVRNLTECFSSMKRMGLLVNIGVIMKF